MSENIMLAIGDKQAPLGVHHAEMISVILKGKFGKEVFTGRKVDYLDGKVSYGNVESQFKKIEK